MKANSGSGKGKNNLHDPTMKEHEREQGRSGRAIQGEKKVAAQPSRKESRSDANVN